MASQIIKVRTSRALELFGGSVPRLAEHLEISRAAVHQWGDYVPTVRAYQLREDFPDADLAESADNEQHCAA